jgi:hypothetical protein
MGTYTADEVERALGIIAHDVRAHTYQIESSSGRGFVVAARCKVRENELGIFESSLMYADREWSKDEYGVVLAVF